MGSRSSAFPHWQGQGAGGAYGAGALTADGVLGLAKYTGGTAGDGSSFEITKLEMAPASFSLWATSRRQFYHPHDPHQLSRLQTSSVVGELTAPIWPPAPED